jgi:hypothetical protein
MRAVSVPSGCPGPISPSQKTGPYEDISAKDGIAVSGENRCKSVVELWNLRFWSFDDEVNVGDVQHCFGKERETRGLAGEHHWGLKLNCDRARVLGLEPQGEIFATFQSRISPMWRRDGVWGFRELETRVS